jgi:hypothetical protein
LLTSSIGWILFISDVASAFCGVVAYLMSGAILKLLVGNQDGDQLTIFVFALGERHFLWFVG